MVKLMINDKVCEIHLPLGTPLADVIRDHEHLSGTKIGCREGDCGACTVIVGKIVDNQVKYETMTSCIVPLGNVDGHHVVTIEGLDMGKLGPIQQAFIDENGTQCGFCTPGFIVSLMGFCLSSKQKNDDNIKSAVGGNICRCTGYKSIERALKIILEKIRKMDSKNPIGWLVKHQFLPAYFENVKAALEQIALQKDQVVKNVVSDGPSGDTVLIMGGGTDLLVQELDEVEQSNVCCVSNRVDLKGIELRDDYCYIGAATTTTDLYESAVFLDLFPQMKNYLKLISSTQIRNMATIAGNICNGSPIGDLAIMMQALDAVAVFSKQDKKREVRLKDFFLGYKKVDRSQGELLEYIYFKTPDEYTHLSFEKIGKRIYLDMATVNSALCLYVKDDVIESASYSVGGLGPTIRNMEKTAEYLKGKIISDDTFIEANKVAQSEITPRSRPEYKRLLVRQQLFCHFQNISGGILTLDALANS